MKLWVRLFCKRCHGHFWRERRRTPHGVTVGYCNDCWPGVVANGLRQVGLL